MSELAAYLQAHIGDRVPDDIVREAARQGHQIDRTVVYRYIQGDHAKRPRQSTLAALAAGFGLDVRELRRLAGKPAGELGPYTPTDEAASLTQDQRDALDALIKAIVRGGSSEVQHTEAQKNDDGGAAASGSKPPGFRQDNPHLVLAEADQLLNPVNPYAGIEERFSAHVWEVQRDEEGRGPAADASLVDRAADDRTNAGRALREQLDAESERFDDHDPGEP